MGGFADGFYRTEPMVKPAILQQRETYKGSSMVVLRTGHKGELLRLEIWQFTGFC